MPCLLPRFAVLGFAVIAVAACASARPAGTVEAPMIVDVAAVGSAPPPAVDTTPRPTMKTGTCRLSVTLDGEISKSSSGCYLDEHVSGTVGVLAYDCDGEGEAYAVFDAQRYEGRVHEGEIDIQADTELDWEDGCRWGTTAILRGPVTGKLVWTYADRVLTGTNCSGTCRANATFDVSDPK